MDSQIKKEKIKVMVHIPKEGEIPEYIREQKINQLYNILAPKTNKNNLKQNLS